MSHSVGGSCLIAQSLHPTGHRADTSRTIPLGFPGGVLHLAVDHLEALACKVDD